MFQLSHCAFVSYSRHAKPQSIFGMLCVLVLHQIAARGLCKHLTHTWQNWVHTTDTRPKKKSHTRWCCGILHSISPENGSTRTSAKADCDCVESVRYCARRMRTHTQTESARFYDTSPVWLVRRNILLANRCVWCTRGLCLLEAQEWPHV